MISFARSYQTEDGTCYASLEDAQVVEVMQILKLEGDAGERVGREIVGKKAELVNILTITDSSRPRARGVRKPRKPKTVGTLPLDQSAA